VSVAPVETGSGEGAIVMARSDTVVEAVVLTVAELLLVSESFEEGDCETLKALANLWAVLGAVTVTVAVITPFSGSVPEYAQVTVLPDGVHGPLPPSEVASVPEENVTPAGSV
jgi:hypothetical protein